MNIQNQFQLRHLVLLAGAALWGAATPLAAQDAPTISVSDATVVKPTGAGQSAEFVVTRSGDTTDPVTVGYRTQDGTAKAGVDYTAARGVVMIPAGATSANIQVPVLPGQKVVPQDFVLQLTGASGPLQFSRPGTDSVLEAMEIDIGNPLTNLILGDFNGDGRLDLAGEDAEGRLSFALNSSANGVATPTFDPTTNFEPATPLAVADFNADGKTDLVVNDGSLSVVLNLILENGPLSFSAPTPLLGDGSSAGFVPGLAVADFNGDQKPDIFVCNTKVVPVFPGIPPEVVSSVFLNTTSGGDQTASFEEMTDIPISCTEVISTDLNPDGKPDIAARSVFSRTGEASVSVLRNVTEKGASKADFQREQFPQLSNGTLPNLALDDFDGDGRPDVVVGGELVMNLSPPGGAFDFALPTFLYTFQFTERVSSTTGDFDADGRADILFNGQLFLNSTAEGVPSASFTKSIISNIPLNPFETLSGPFATGDLNGDGKPELVGRSVLMFPAASVQLSKAQGTGTILPNADTTPARFSFIDRFFVARGQPQVSNAIFVRGINQPAPIAVNGGSYSINNGPYVTSPGLAKNGDRVRVALFAPNQFNTAAHVQLTVGGVSDVFTTRTRGPVLDNFLSRLFGFDFLNQGGFAIAGLTGSAIR